MNLWWIGGLALYVLAEKTLSSGHWIGYGFGFMLVIWGCWMMISV
jgi:predicted metal-binding membrane protein